jgi:hypothetical protein
MDRVPGAGLAPITPGWGGGGGARGVIRTSSGSLETPGVRSSSAPRPGVWRPHLVRESGDSREDPSGSLDTSAGSLVTPGRTPSRKSLEVSQLRGTPILNCLGHGAQTWPQALPKLSLEWFMQHLPNQTEPRPHLQKVIWTGP